MAEYIDGFVLPIARNNLEEYRRLVTAIAKIWKQHGALKYSEYIADDLMLAGTRSFTDAIEATQDEVIVFGWVEFESRQARDEANKKVADDPEVADLVANSKAGFNAERMLYGGFQAFVPPAK